MAQFPNNPSIGQQYVDAQAGITYTWDGFKWITTQAPFNVGATGATGFGYGIYAYSRTPITGNFATAFQDGFSNIFYNGGTGNYEYTFNQPILGVDADKKYGVIVTPVFTGNPNDIDVIVTETSGNGFQVRLYRGQNTAIQCEHTVQVVSFEADGPTGTGSAYQSWLSVGNFGTQSQFLDTLVGPIGATGATGVIGPAGSTGPVGATGIPGQDGTSVELKGTVPFENDLLTPALLASAEGDLYIVLNDLFHPRQSLRLVTVL